MLILRNAKVWPGKGSGVCAASDVVIRGGVVTAVGNRCAALRPLDATGVGTAVREVDCTGKWVIPGLIDLHVHLVWDGSLDPVAPLLGADPLLTAIRAAGNAARTLRAGITTVRDLGSNANIAIHLARAIAEGSVPGPRIIAAGRTVVMTGGHDPFWGNMADGVDGVLRATREQVYAGSGVIKVSATGGVYGRTEGEDAGASELNPDELAAIAGEAHKFGLRVAAHAIGEAGIRDCLNAGIDSIEHGHYLTSEMLGFMAEHGRAWVPTLHIYRRIAAGEGIPAYAQRKAEAIVERHRTAFRAALERNVLIGAGSDAGSPGLPHPAVGAELLALADAGIEPWQALETATSKAAAVLGPAGKGLGVIEAGAVADLLVLDADPLGNLANLGAVQMVIQGGRVITG